MRGRRDHYVNVDLLSTDLLLTLNGKKILDLHWYINPRLLLRFYLRLLHTVKVWGQKRVPYGCGNTRECKGG